MSRLYALLVAVESARSAGPGRRSGLFLHLFGGINRYGCARSARRSVSSAPAGLPACHARCAGRSPLTCARSTTQIRIPVDRSPCSSFACRSVSEEQLDAWTASYFCLNRRTMGYQSRRRIHGCNAAHGWALPRPQPRPVVKSSHDSQIQKRPRYCWPPKRYHLHWR